MKTRIGSISVLAVAVLFGLSTLSFAQTQTKTAAAPAKAKTEVKVAKDSSKVKKAPLAHKKHAAKEAKAEKKAE
jgi:hypothetical protein